MEYDIIEGTIFSRHAFATLPARKKRLPVFLCRRVVPRTRIQGRGFSRSGGVFEWNQHIKKFILGIAKDGDKTVPSGLALKNGNSTFI
jgi:hypothetical protein